jgi:hypothetical protein
MPHVLGSGENALDDGVEELARKSASKAPALFWLATTSAAMDPDENRSGEKQAQALCQGNDSPMQTIYIRKVSDHLS